jgi:putative membrane protein
VTEAAVSAAEGPVLRCRRHKVVIVVELVSLIPAALLFLGLLAVGGRLAGLPHVLPLATVATSAFWASLAWTRWTATTLTLTNQRVIWSSGVLRRFRKSIPLERVQSVSTRQSIPGRLLGYGTVEIGVGGQHGPDRYRHIPMRWLRDEVFVLWESR